MFKPFKPWQSAEAPKTPENFKLFRNPQLGTVVITVGTPVDIGDGTLEHSFTFTFGEGHHPGGETVNWTVTSAERAPESGTSSLGDTRYYVVPISFDVTMRAHLVGTLLDGPEAVVLSHSL